MKRLGQLSFPVPQRSNPIYGRVFFALRRQFGLSAPECLLLDVVDTLSRRTGWCFASRAYLAGLLGVSSRSVQRMLAHLLDRGLVERHSQIARQIRPSRRWHDARASALR